MNVNKRWHYSCWSRFMGIVFFGIFTVFTINIAEDILSHAIFQVILVFGCFIFTIIIPDKIIFRKYLVPKTDERSNK